VFANSQQAVTAKLVQNSAESGFGHLSLFTFKNNSEYWIYYFQIDYIKRRNFVLKSKGKADKSLMMTFSYCSA
jgi:hypothetical protein